MRIWPPDAAAVFGGVVGRQDLHFLGRIHVGDADAGAVGARAYRRRAVERDGRSCERAPLTGVAAVGQAEVEIAQRGAAAHAGLQRRHEERIAAVQLQGVDLARVTSFSTAADSVCKPRIGDHFHCLARRAHRQGGVDGERRVRVELVVRLSNFLKPAASSSAIVSAGGNSPHNSPIRWSWPALTPVASFEDDLGLRNDCPAGILDKTDDGSVICLRLQNGGYGEQRHGCSGKL